MSAASATESTDPTLEAAMKGAGVIWLAPAPAPGTDGDRAAQGDGHLPSTTGPVWHVWSDGACYLLTGPGEQPLPGIVDGGRCEVTVRNSVGGRAITWTAGVRALDPAGQEWAAIAPMLAAGRLNGGDPASVVPTWPGRLAILCLRPTGDLSTAATGLSDDSHAAAPLPSPATTPYRMPSDLTRTWRLRRAAKKTTR